MTTRFQSNIVIINIIYIGIVFYDIIYQIVFVVLQKLLQTYIRIIMKLFPFLSFCDLDCLIVSFVRVSWWNSYKNKSITLYLSEISGSWLATVARKKSTLQKKLPYIFFGWPPRSFSTGFSRSILVAY